MPTNVEQANSELKKTLNLLKQMREGVLSELDPSLREFVKKGLRDSSNHMNEILYGAIEHFPTMVNAVYVKTAINLLNPESQTFDRGGLEDFLKEQKESDDFAEQLKFEFVKLLPYTSTSERIGDHTITISDRTDGHPLKIPLIQISLSQEQKIEQYAYLLPNEIESIQLLQLPEKYFTKTFGFGDEKSVERNTVEELLQSKDETKSREIKLKDVEHSIIHYAKHLGFSEDKSARQNIPSRWNKINERFNYHSTHLWTPKKFKMVTGESGVEKWFNGFALEKQIGGAFTLYEFKGVRIPFGLRNDSTRNPTALSLYGIYRERRDDLKNIVSYQGAEIIQKLSGK